MKEFIIKTLSTFFYIGYLPRMPGTFASIAVALLVFLIKGNGILYWVFTLLILFLGFLVCGKAEKIFNKKDASCIVIDEVAGMCVSLAFIPYCIDIRIVIVALLIFRILDIKKPYPIKALQKLNGSLGVMSDDIAAGICTNIILQIALRLISFKAS